MTEQTRGQWKKAWKHAAFFAAYAVAFVFVWYLVCQAVENEYLFPSLGEILRATGRLFTEEFFYTAFLQTLWRVVKVFCVSLLSALVFAVLAKAVPIYSRNFSRLI